jgi:fatty-acyl-CoA synthase
VIGVPDERFGEQLMAWIVTKPGATLDEDIVRAYCRDNISHFKVPAYVKFVDGFPMTVTGKVQKYKMREQAIAELGLERAAAIVTA